MIENMFSRPSARARHLDAPLLKERREYLTYLATQGKSPESLNTNATILLHTVRLLRMENQSSIYPIEISTASKRWVEEEGFRKRGNAGKTSAYHFERITKNWLRFHRLLKEVSVLSGPFDPLVSAFADYLKLVRGLSSTSVGTHKDRVSTFFIWLAHRHDCFASVCLADVDDYFAWCRAAGWQPRTLKGVSQSLRTLFKYCELQKICRPGIARGILSPVVPSGISISRGPMWKDVRRLIKSMGEMTRTELRARAIILLCAIYGLRSSEIIRMRLNDFDWYNETFIVTRSKRGRVQQFPIQHEVGEAILRYLLNGRSRCSCRSLFVTRYPLYRPISPGTIFRLISERMKGIGIKSVNFGAHSLRHACATQLLKKGSSLRCIADFLGHRDIESVSIYAKYDHRSLRKVAAFPLKGVL